jgi:hypothetical protein
MDIIIGTRRHPKKFNLPHSSQDKPEDNDAPRKSWRCEKLTDRQEVRDSRKRQRRHEIWSASVGEVACTDR